MLKFRKATKEDKAFIVDANNSINKLSGVKNKSRLSENFEKDFLENNPKAFCLIVEDENEKIAFCIYSHTYWATQGSGVYLSNVYVEPKHRRKGVLKAIINHLKNMDDVNFITMLLGN